jgi:tRNA pseudouridine synthase 10
MTTVHRGTEGVFHGAGREDVDATMVGTGRPFVLEVKQPRRRRIDLPEIEQQINNDADGAVEVEELQYATHDMIDRVKRHDASKRYRMAIEFGEPVTADAFELALERLQGETLEQRTPNRVSHRRADRVRERTVYDIEGSRESQTEATVEVHGEGGLYVKELVSGDEGRTEPSLSWRSRARQSRSRRRRFSSMPTGNAKSRDRLSRHHALWRRRSWQGAGHRLDVRRSGPGPGPPATE